MNENHRQVPDHLDVQIGSVKDTRQLPSLNRPEYYMKPSKVELQALLDKSNQCRVQELTIGHEKYGSVTFYGTIDLLGLNLDEIGE